MFPLRSRAGLTFRRVSCSGPLPNEAGDTLQGFKAVNLNVEARIWPDLPGGECPNLAGRESRQSVSPLRSEADYPTRPLQGYLAHKKTPPAFTFLAESVPISPDVNADNLPRPTRFRAHHVEEIVRFVPHLVRKPEREREFFIYKLLVRIHYIIVMIE